MKKKTVTSKHLQIFVFGKKRRLKKRNFCMVTLATVYFFSKLCVCVCVLNTHQAVLSAELW